jgi:integrase/recombinase XerD
MREERDLSQMTVLTRHEQLRPFFDALESVYHVRALKQITVQRIDRNFIEQSERGWGRASLSTLASTLRSFFRYAEVQRWCQSGLAATIDSPTLYAQESLPPGRHGARCEH